MLTKRIIPCLDIKAGRVVKGIKFEGLRDAGDPVEVAKLYEDQEADELVFLDITASYEGREILLELVKKTAENIFMPFTVGGGIRNIGDIRNLLNAGAEKVSLNTQAVKNPALITEAASRFGSQCIVVAIDAKSCCPVSPLARYPVQKSTGNRQTDNGQTKKWQVYINGGRTPTALEALTWAKEAQARGAGEILLTSMDFDGTKDGYDLELTRRVCEAVNIPVIASGGAGKLKHFYEVLAEAGADAALAASVFHYAKFSVREIKQYLFERQVKVRL